MQGKYINLTSIHCASSRYHAGVFQSHVATKKNGVPAINNVQIT
jgi:hypothetical protein